MACKNCGSVIQDGLSTCPVCGTVQDNASEKINEEISNTVMQTPNTFGYSNLPNQQQNFNDNPVTQEKIINEQVNPVVLNKYPKKSNLMFIFAVILGSLILIIIVLFLSGILKFSDKSSKQIPGRDINTINDKQDTSKTTKLTTTTEAITESSLTGEINVYGDNYNVPVGFSYQEKNGTSKAHYLVRSSAGAIIGFDLVNAPDITLDSFLETVVSLYDANKVKVEVSDILEKDGYKYYEITQYDDTIKKDIKEHTELLIEQIDGSIFNAFLYDVTSFGKDNYLNVLFNFIKSRKVSESTIIQNSKPSFAVNAADVFNN